MMCRYLVAYHLQHFYACHVSKRINHQYFVYIVCKFIYKVYSQEVTATIYSRRVYYVQEIIGRVQI